MAFPVKLYWRSSRMLLGLILASHLAGLVCLSFTSLPSTAVVAAAVLIVASAGHVFSVWGASRGELRLHQDGRCDYRRTPVEEFVGARVKWYAEWPAIVSAAIEIGESPSRRIVLIGAGGALSADERRQFTLWLRCCASATETAPDQVTG